MTTFVEFVEELWITRPSEFKGDSKSYCVEVDANGSDAQVIERIEKAIRQRRKIKCIIRYSHKNEIKAVLESKWWSRWLGLESSGFY